MGCCPSEPEQGDGASNEKRSGGRNSSTVHQDPDQRREGRHNNNESYYQGPRNDRHRSPGFDQSGQASRAADGYKTRRDLPPRPDGRGDGPSWDSQAVKSPKYDPTGRFEPVDEDDGNSRFSNRGRERPREKTHLYDNAALDRMKEEPDPYVSNEAEAHPTEGGMPWEKMISRHSKPLRFTPMKNAPRDQFSFIIKHFEYHSSKPDERPYPIRDTYKDIWDEDHVAMPCSPRNVYPNNQPKWPEIRKMLLYLKQKCEKEEGGFDILQQVFNDMTTTNVELTSLFTLIRSVCTSNEGREAMTKILPFMCELAYDVDRICGEPPRVLRSGRNESVTMSQIQAASLVACSFFCLFPQRPERHGKRERRDRHERESSGIYENFPSPNFFRLFQGGESSKVQKLRCFLHYFKRILEKKPTGVITFRRHAISKGDYPRWNRSNNQLSDLHLTNSRKIEDFPDALQVDFANKFIGGGVLGHGCVQEEIRFTICPEMLVSLLLCQKMEDNEAIFLIGCERYSNYDGYADSFKFAGDYRDKSARDNWGRLTTHLVAIDAVDYRDRRLQFEEHYIYRELNKAYVGFMSSDTTDQQAADYPIITGNWGCGAFNGDRQLKALIQLMAASESKRPVTYAAYGDRHLVIGMNDIYNYLVKQNATVADLHAYLIKYSKQKDLRPPIFDLIKSIPVQHIRS